MFYLKLVGLSIPIIVMLLAMPVIGILISALFILIAGVVLAYAILKDTEEGEE